MKQIIVALCLGILCTSISFGQPAPDPRIEKAQKLEAEKAFKKAFKLYEKVHRDAPDNKAITYKLASMAQTSQNYKKANKIL